MFSQKTVLRMTGLLFGCTKHSIMARASISGISGIFVCDLYFSLSSPSLKRITALPCDRLAFRSVILSIFYGQPYTC